MATPRAPDRLHVQTSASGTATTASSLVASPAPRAAPAQPGRSCRSAMAAREDEQREQRVELPPERGVHEEGRRQREQQRGAARGRVSEDAAQAQRAQRGVGGGGQQVGRLDQEDGRPAHLPCSDHPPQPLDQGQEVRDDGRVVAVGPEVREVDGPGPPARRTPAPRSGSSPRRRSDGRRGAPCRARARAWPRRPPGEASLRGEGVRSGDGDHVSKNVLEIIVG